MPYKWHTLCLRLDGAETELPSRMSEKPFLPAAFLINFEKVNNLLIRISVLLHLAMGQ